MKKRKPGTTFLFFFLAMTVLLSALLLTGMLWLDGIARLDYQETRRYQETIGTLLEDAVKVGYGKQSNGALEKESRNISYLIESPMGGVWGDNTAAQTAKALLDEATRGLGNGDYSHLLYLREGKLQEQLKTNHGYYTHDYFLDVQRPPYLLQYDPALFCAGLPGTFMTVVIAVRSPTSLLNTGAIYDAYYFWHQTATALLAVAAICWAALLILLITLFKHRSLGAAHRTIGRAVNHLWVEVKLPTLLVSGIFFGWSGVETLTCEVLFVPGLLITLGCFWWCWLVLTDLAVNRRAFFTRNIITTITGFMRSLESPYDFLKRMKRRPVILLGIEAVLVALLCLLPLLGDVGWILDGFVLALMLFLLGLSLRDYFRNINEFARVVTYTEEIRNGTAAKPLSLSGDFAELADDLNCIHSGINRAVEERVRSEQMKVELITNVSHDLKTPLTSIMNYVDLLGRETLSPEYCNDYVRVLEQKSSRLKNMVQDLFEISKANSGNIDLHMERLDVVALVEQTLAEMDSRTGQAGVEVKTQFDVGRLLVYADGKKLHRVFENLLGNALKYSMTGTRVYLSVRREENLAVITFKNVSNYEMNFTAQEIVERFQRGDASRATEGSGLGLAIAKSFLELCGGSLKIELDGDLFKVIVLLSASDAPLAPPVPEEPLPELLRKPSAAAIQEPDTVAPPEAEVSSEPPAQADSATAAPIEASAEALPQ